MWFFREGTHTHCYANEKKTILLLRFECSTLFGWHKIIFVVHSRQLFCQECRELLKGFFLYKYFILSILSSDKKIKYNNAHDAPHARAFACLRHFNLKKDDFWCSPSFVMLWLRCCPLLIPMVAQIIFEPNCGQHLWLTQLHIDYVCSLLAHSA